MELKEAYKHCPRCGAALRPKDSFKVCPDCGLSVYFNPKPCVVVALINDAGEILLAKRGIEPAKGLWDLPGGFVELGETLEENAVRELKEELGIDIDPASLHYVTSSTVGYLFEGIDYPLVAACFVAKMPAGAEPKADDDVAECRYFSFDDLPEAEFSYPSMGDDLQEVAHFIKNSRL